MAAKGTTRLVFRLAIGRSSKSVGLASVHIAKRPTKPLAGIRAALFWQTASELMDELPVVAVVV